MIKRYFKDMEANEEHDFKCPAKTCCIEFNAAAPSEFNIVTSDGVMVYSDDTRNHSHSFLIKIGNRFVFVNTSDVIEAADIAVSQFPLTISCNAACTLNVYDL